MVIEARETGTLIGSNKVEGTTVYCAVRWAHGALTLASLALGFADPN
jgi:hypothetical protein